MGSEPRVARQAEDIVQSVSASESKSHARSSWIGQPEMPYSSAASDGPIRGLEFIGSLTDHRIEKECRGLHFSPPEHRRYAGIRIQAEFLFDNRGQSVELRVKVQEIPP